MRHKETAMARAISEGWYKLKLPSNEAADVATAIIICSTANRGDAGEVHHNAKLPFAGKILWVGGGQTYEIEDRIQALEPQWLGEQNSKELARGQAYLASMAPRREV